MRAGRLVLDEPTTLPEGTEVLVTVVDGDDLDEADRAALHAAIAESEAELDAGRGVPESELWAKLRSSR